MLDNGRKKLDAYRKCWRRKREREMDGQSESVTEGGSDGKTVMRVKREVRWNKGMSSGKREGGCLMTGVEG